MKAQRLSLLAILGFGGLLLAQCGIGQAQERGMRLAANSGPGSATPNPYPAVTPSPTPAPVYRPPLLNDGRGQRAPGITPPARDQSLPLLEQQLQRNREGLKTPAPGSPHETIKRSP